MTIKTIRKWFGWTIKQSLDWHGYFIGSTVEKQWKKNIRMAERALNELKKYK